VQPSWRCFGDTYCCQANALIEAINRHGVSNEQRDGVSGCRLSTLRTQALAAAAAVTACWDGRLVVVSNVIPCGLVELDGRKATPHHSKSINAGPNQPMALSSAKRSFRTGHKVNESMLAECTAELHDIDAKPDCPDFGTLLPICRANQYPLSAGSDNSSND